MLDTNLRQDESGLIPLIIGVALAGVLGISWLVAEDPFAKLYSLVLPSVLITIGIIALWGKFIPILGVFGSLIVGLLTIGVGGYIIYVNFGVGVL